MRYLKIVLCMVLLLGIISWTAPAEAATTTLSTTKTTTSLSFSKPALSLEVGGSEAIKLTAFFSDGSSQDVTMSANWSITVPSTSSNSTVATINNGVISAVNDGTAYIKADYDNLNITVPVTVSKKVTALTANMQDIYLRSNTSSTPIVLTAYYEGSTNSDATVASVATWTSGDNKIATVANGTITGHNAGTTTVTAKYGSQTVIIDVSVELVHRLDADKTMINMLLNVPENIKITATYPDGTTDATIADKATWTSTNTKVADFIKGTGGASGTIRAYGPGDATLTASYGTKSIDIQVSVDKTTKLEFNEQSLFMKTGSSYTLQVFATFATGTTAGQALDYTDKATWASSDTSVLTVYNGKLTALKSGSATITAKYGDKTATLPVDVEVPRRLEFIKPVDNSVLTASSIAMKANDTSELQLKAYYADGTGEDVSAKATWASSNEDVAMVRNTTNGATITSYKSGDANITATFGGKSLTVAVNIDIPRKLDFKAYDPATDKATDITASAISLSLNGTKTLQVFATYGEGRGSEDVTSAVDISSSDAGVVDAYYDSQQSAIVVTANSKGKASITAKYGTRSVSMQVEIAQAARLEASVKTLKMGKDDPVQITLTAYDSAGTKDDTIASKAEWSISTASLADVTNGLVTPLDSGKGTITAKYGGKSVTIAVEIKVVSKLEFSKKFLSMKSGDAEQLALNVTFTDGTVVDVAKDAEWKVGSFKVADIDTTGKVTAIGYGKTKITAKYNNKSVSLDIDVDQLKYLKTDIINLEMTAGTKKQVVATATFTDNTDKDVSIDGLWKSSSIRVADVKDGLIVANGKGKATITVTFGGKSTKVWVVIK